METTNSPAPPGHHHHQGYLESSGVFQPQSDDLCSPKDAEANVYGSPIQKSGNVDRNKLSQ